MSSVDAANIIWVSDNKESDDTDQGWIDLLAAQGYTVDLSFRNQEGRTLDDDKIAALNAVDLIIVSRDTNSSSYDDGDEPTQWNSVTTPLILQMALIYRSSRWGWMDSTSTSRTTADLLAVLPDHPVFTGVALDANNRVNILTAESNVGDNNVDPTNNYTLIATRSDSGADGVWIAEWEPGVEFYPGSGQFAGGPRMWFAAGSTDSQDGEYNLNAEGEKLFLNAVRYMLGETGGPGQASDPKPANEATDVPRDAVLSWTPGEYAPPINGHKVYLSENFSDVNDGIGGIAQDANSYARPQRLNFGTTYYWRVDEVNGAPDYTVYEGSVWSFTTEPIAYPIQNIIATASSSGTGRGPENTVNGSGLDDSGLFHGKDGDNNMWLSGATGPQPSWIEFQFDNVYQLHEMWVWNYNEFMEPVLGLGIKDASIEYSVNGTDYTTLGTTAEFARAPGAPDYAHNTTIDFGGVPAKYVRLTVNSNWGGILPQYGLSEVLFFHIPLRAREPYPDSGAADVDVDVTLGFRAGREAAEHNLYLSTDGQAVIDSNVPVTTITETSHGPLSLDLGKTYYWKTNEVNTAETPTMLEGDLWNFTTREFLIVDDIESYNDLDPGDLASKRIFTVWIDGYGIATNGSVVGYENVPFCEQTIVHSDKQSMPFFFSNTGTAAYSQADRTFAVPQNWTEAGVATLVLYFHGTAGSTGQLYAKINDSKVVYDGDAADMAKPRWKQWNIDLASLGANLQNVTKLSIGIDGIGASGTLYFDDFRLYRLAPEAPFEIWFEAEVADSITEPVKIYPAAGVDPVNVAGGAGEPSGGLYIGTTAEVPGNNDNPGTQDIATYTFTVPAGTYAIWGRVSNVDNDSFWVHIPDGQYDVPVHSSGWITWNSIEPETADWHWVQVHSDDAPDNAVVNVTLTAGQHTILWAHRESQNFLDAFVITDKLD